VWLVRNKSGHDGLGRVGGRCTCTTMEQYVTDCNNGNEVGSDASNVQVDAMLHPSSTQSHGAAMEAYMKKVIEGLVVRFEFDGLEPVVFDASRVSGANRERAMMHGFAARIGDNAAIQKSAENGYTVTEAMRREAVLELVDHYHGESVWWSPKKASGPRAAPQNQFVAELAKRLGVTYDEAMAKVAAQAMAEMGAMTQG
jgi:hypothetical protein